MDALGPVTEDFDVLEPLPPRRSRDPDANRARVSTFLHAEIRWALRQSPVGERDLVIAAVARVHGLTLVTGNAREFNWVPDLPVEEWAG